VAEPRLRAGHRRHLDREGHGADRSRLRAHAAGRDRRVRPHANEWLVCLGIWASGCCCTPSSSASPCRCWRAADLSKRFGQDQRGTWTCSAGALAKARFCHERPHGLIDRRPSRRGRLRRARPGLGPAGHVARRPGPASTATRGKPADLPAVGQTASTTAPTSAATSATAQEGEPDAFEHEGQWIATIVSPKDCARCHAKEVEEFATPTTRRAPASSARWTTPWPRSSRATGAWSPAPSPGRQRRGGQRLLAVPRQRGQGPARRQARPGHLAQHGDRPHQSRRLRRLLLRMPQPARLLGLPGPPPRQLRQVPHGPDHPQKEIYYESKHGIAFRQHRRLNMDSPSGSSARTTAAPTCATCHMTPGDATQAAGAGDPRRGHADQLEQPAGASRSARGSDKKMGLPGADVNWQTPPQQHEDVCINCHEQQWVDNFYVQYDSLIELYHRSSPSPARSCTSWPSRCWPKSSSPTNSTGPGTRCGTTRAAGPATAPR
jgi:hypothetical protein